MIYPDKELVAKINAGNTHVFRLLVSQHEQMVLRLVGRMLHDKDDQADVAQEVFIKVYRHLKNFAFHSKLSTWIGQIAYTTALDHLKKNKRYMAENQIAEIEYHVDYGDDPERILNQKEIRNFIQRAIDRLPSAYQVVVVLFHQEGFSYHEIAEITGMPESSVKSNLFRARKMLKEQLKDLMV